MCILSPGRISEVNARDEQDSEEEEEETKSDKVVSTVNDDEQD